MGKVGGLIDSMQKTSAPNMRQTIILLALATLVASYRPAALPRRAFVGRLATIGGGAALVGSRPEFAMAMEEAERTTTRMGGLLEKVRSLGACCWLLSASLCQFRRISHCSGSYFLRMSALVSTLSLSHPSFSLFACKFSTKTPAADG